MTERSFGLRFLCPSDIEDSFCEDVHNVCPAFFVFLEVLVKLLATIYVKMRGTNVVAPYKKTEREINELILRQYEKYTSG